MKELIKLLYLPLSIITIGCVTQQKLSIPNPTSYIFGSNLEQVKEAIKDVKKVTPLKSFRFIYAENSINEDSILFSKQANCNDVILINFSASHDSKIYYKFGKTVYYNAKYHIHLDSVSTDKTKVEIYTLKPHIITFFLGGQHGINRSKNVLPSTIEEYEILLAIGKQLGQEGMLPCNYPEKWLQYQAKEQERIKKQNTQLYE